MSVTVLETEQEMEPLEEETREEEVMVPLPEIELELIPDDTGPVLVRDPLVMEPVPDERDPLAEAEAVLVMEPVLVDADPVLVRDSLVFELIPEETDPPAEVETVGDDKEPVLTMDPETPLTLDNEPVLEVDI